MCSLCLLDVQVAVEWEEWMVLAIDKYDYGIFSRQGSDYVQRNLYLNCVSLYEKLLKACDIVWFVASACNLRRQ